MLLSVSLATIQRAYADNVATLKIINPLTDDEWFNFTTKDKKIGDTFLANVEMHNATDVATWMVDITWDSNILNYSNYTNPPNDGFHILSPPIGSPGPELTSPGELLYGYAIGPGQAPFSGDTLLFQIEFKVIAETGYTLIHFNFLDNYTYVLDNNGYDVSFTVIDGHYVLSTYTGLKGDVNDDGVIDMSDIYLALAAFNSFTGSNKWNPRADTDGNGRVNMRDIFAIILYFNKR
jgi:hypothetical protein